MRGKTKGWKSRPARTLASSSCRGGGTAERPGSRTAEVGDGDSLVLCFPLSHIFQTVFNEHVLLLQGLLRWLSGKESACQCRRCVREMQVWSLGREDPLEEELTNHSSLLDCGQRCLAGYGPWGCKESGHD